MHNNWTPPEAIPNDGAGRPVKVIDFVGGQRGTDLVAEMSAALAAGSMVFRSSGSLPPHDSNDLHNKHVTKIFLKRTHFKSDYRFFFKWPL